MEFYKYCASGNDFVIYADEGKKDRSELAKMLCDRYSGIGADGLIAILPSGKSDESGARQSPIYTQEFFAQYKNLLQDTQRLDAFNILFGANTSLNSTDLNTTLMSLNLSKIKPLNKVDIKA